MTAIELWAELGRLGVTVTADGDTLEVRPATALTADLRAAIRAHKAALLDRARTGRDHQAEPVGWVTVTLILPAGCGLATVAGKWRRLATGEVEATYTPAELQAALWASRPAECQQMTTWAEVTP